MLGGLIGLGDSGVPILPVILGTIIAGFFLGGMIRMAVNQVRGRRPHLSDLTSITDVWFDLALGSGLLGLFLYVGWHLLVIPGLIVGGLLMFMYPLIVDGRLPATGAILQSYHGAQDSMADCHGRSPGRHRRRRTGWPPGRNRPRRDGAALRTLDRRHVSRPLPQPLLTHLGKAPGTISKSFEPKRLRTQRSPQPLCQCGISEPLPARPG